MKQHLSGLILLTVLAGKLKRQKAAPVQMMKKEGQILKKTDYRNHYPINVSLNQVLHLNEGIHVIQVSWVKNQFFSLLAVTINYDRKHITPIYAFGRFKCSTSCSRNPSFLDKALIMIIKIVYGDLDITASAKLLVLPFSSLVITHLQDE